MVVEKAQIVERLPIEDFGFLREARAEGKGPLGKVREKKVPKREVLVCCTCSNQERLLQRHIMTVRGGDIPHIVSHPGGIIALHPKAPFLKNGYQAERLLEQLVELLETDELGFGGVSGYLDIPCQHLLESPRDRPLFPADLFVMTAEVKTLIKERNKTPVGCFVFVDYGQRRDRFRDDRSYFFAREDLGQWLEKRHLPPLR